MTRRTKIIASIGPASDDPRVLKGLIQSGMDIARINLSHESLDLALERYHRIRAVAAELGRPVGILADLPGPKVRLGKLPGDGVLLVDGQEFFITPGTDASTTEVFQVDYEDLLTDIHEGDQLVFGDGAVQVQSLGRQGDRLRVRVNHGGHLTGRPGIHIPSDRLRIATPTPEDLRFLDAFVDVGVDMVALSFVRSAHDVRRVGVEPAPRGPMVVAKIETRAAVQNLASILEGADGLMVARGDMGVELGPEAVPPNQKKLIDLANAARKPVITATQMLESMILNPRPTRAEASDVANAIYDGTSAVMLSAETASGKHPVRSVRIMEKIIRTAERDVYSAMNDRRRRHQSAKSGVTSATVRAAAYAAYEAKAKLIAVYTETGTTAQMLAGERPPTHVVAFTPSTRTLQRLALTWGIVPRKIRPGRTSHELTLDGDRIMQRQGLVRPGDRIVQIAGTVRQTGLTNTMSIRQF